MEIQTREVNCACGHTYESIHKINWCPKCGQKIFETDKETRAHKMNDYYMYAVVVLAMSALAFFFIKLVIIPVASM